MDNLFPIVRVFAGALMAVAAFTIRPLQAQRGPTLVRTPDPPPKVVQPFSVLKQQPALQFLSGACPPVTRPVSKRVPILTDLYCRVKNPDYFADPREPDDLVTHVHELTHGVSNRLHATTQAHGIYLLDGKGIVLKHPNITIEQVANSVPPEKRGRIFDLYLVQQRKDWNRSPIYLLDEHNAYIHGTIAHKQLGLGKERWETYSHAKEMEGYVQEMVKVVEKRDPGYADMTRLKAFVEWQSDRLAQLGTKGD